MKIALFFMTALLISTSTFARETTLSNQDSRANDICIAQKIVSDMTMRYFVSCSDGSNLYTDNILTFPFPDRWTGKANNLLRSDMLDRNYFLNAKIAAKDQRWFRHDVLVFAKKKQEKSYCIVKISNPNFIGYKNKTTIYDYNLACNNHANELFTGITNEEFDSIMANRKFDFVFQTADSAYKDVQSFRVYQQ